MALMLANQSSILCAYSPPRITLLAATSALAMTSGEG